MKTKEDVYLKMLKLRDIGVSIVLKYSTYIPEVSFEFTKIPTPERNESIKSLSTIQIMLYANDTFDVMCDRIDRFLQQKEDFLNQYATDDFKQLTDFKGIGEYLKNKDIK